MKRFSLRDLVVPIEDYGFNSRELKFIIDVAETFDDDNLDFSSLDVEGYSDSEKDSINVTLRVHLDSSLIPKGYTQPRVTKLLTDAVNLGLIFSLDGLVEPISGPLVDVKFQDGRSIPAEGTIMMVSFGVYKVNNTEISNLEVTLL